MALIVGDGVGDWVGGGVGHHYYAAIAVVEGWAAWSEME